MEQLKFSSLDKHEVPIKNTNLVNCTYKTINRSKVIDESKEDKTSSEHNCDDKRKERLIGDQQLIKRRRITLLI